MSDDNRTFGERFVLALAHADLPALRELYDPSVVFYTPFTRGVSGTGFIQAFVGAFHQAFPGLSVSLHDEFASADGTRVALRFSIHWHNTGPFMGHEPTGVSGIECEIHTFRLVDGRVIEHWVGHNTLLLTRQQLIDWGIPVPTDASDPVPPILSVTAPVLNGAQPSA